MSSGGADLDTRELLGVDFALTDYDGALERIDEMIAGPQRGYITCTSVHGLMESRRDPELAAALNGATLNLPDGMPIVWCGISTPRQEKWVARMRPLVKAPVLVSVGAAFDFLAGRVSQAPSWMQRRGLEWAYRLSREPRRLGPRYLRSNPTFLAAVARQYKRERR
jgi:N-acetylglucosaminyldiphosphoundecaprenol N-acetyl-beta-D-mannosaminyltransferase